MFSCPYSHQFLFIYLSYCNHVFIFISGTQKYNASLSASSLLSEVMTEAEKLTGVPASSQKLIINGKALTSLDYKKLIGDCRIQDGTKVMVLGKKYDIEADKMYQDVVKVEQKIADTQKKMTEVFSYAVLVIYMTVLMFYLKEYVSNFPYIFSSLCT